MNYSPGPQGFFHDIYTVLLDPLGYNAHGNGQRLASLENFVILGVILVVLAPVANRRAGLVCTALRVALPGFIPLGFIYTFAALGNLGLITRERTLLFPFLLVVLSIPLSPKGEEPQFDWELRRSERLRRRRGGETATPTPAIAGQPSGPKQRIFRPTSLPIRQPVRLIAGREPPEDPAADPGSPTTDPSPPTG